MGGITMPAQPYRLNITMSISHRYSRERYESIRIGLLFYHSQCTLMSHSDNSAQRCFKSNTPIVYRPNIWQTRGGRAEPIQNYGSPEGSVSGC